MSKLLRVAIFGGGRMALKHAEAIRLQPSAQFVAVADPFLSREDVHAKFGSDIEHFRDPAELLATAKPDIVHIVTPPATHFSLARDSLNAGASVYVEKPFALSAREAAEILDLAEAKGLRACAAHQVLFQRAGQLYQKSLPVIGKLIHVESYFSFKPVRRRPDGGAPLLRESSGQGRGTAAPRPIHCLPSRIRPLRDRIETAPVPASARPVGLPSFTTLERIRMSAFAGWWNWSITCGSGGPRRLANAWNRGGDSFCPRRISSWLSKNALSRSSNG